MTFDSRCSEDAGNILLSYSVSEDAAVERFFFKFLGVCKDASGVRFTCSRSKPFNRKRSNSMKSSFNSEQEALEYKAQHQLFGRVAEPIVGTKKWALNFPLEAHVTVCQPHSSS